MATRLKNAFADCHKLLLTATPLQNNIEKLYGLVSIIDNHYLGDPKIQLFKYLQTDVAAQLGNPNLVLNSFIISNTPMEQVEFWAKEQLAAKEFTDNHVFFQSDSVYIDKMVRMVIR